MVSGLHVTFGKVGRTSRLSLYTCAAGPQLCKTEDWLLLLTTRGECERFAIRIKSRDADVFMDRFACCRPTGELASQETYASFTPSDTNL